MPQRGGALNIAGMFTLGVMLQRHEADGGNCCSKFHQQTFVDKQLNRLTLNLVGGHIIWDSGGLINFGHNHSAELLPFPGL